MLTLRCTEFDFLHRGGLASEGSRSGRIASKGEVIEVGKKGRRYSPRFQFQVVLEVLKGDSDAVEIARAYNIHPTTVSRWKQEFLENGAEVFGKDKIVARYEKRLREPEQLLGKKEVGIALLRDFVEGSS